MPQLLRPLRTLRSSPVLLAFLLFVAVLGLLSLPTACTGAAQARAQCELDAVKSLPLGEPEQITAGQVIALGKRIQACAAPAAPSSPAAPDAGG